jgi:hypothetical protein
MRRMGRELRNFNDNATILFANTTRVFAPSNTVHFFFDPCQVFEACILIQNVFLLFLDSS